MVVGTIKTLKQDQGDGFLLAEAVLFFRHAERVSASYFSYPFCGEKTD
jgi:hypothetical protein